MTDPKLPFVDNVVAHVRDKIGNRPGFSISTVRSDISTMSKTDPGGLAIVLRKVQMTWQYGSSRTRTIPRRRRAAGGCRSTQKEHA
jgi:hypothetical protein